MGQKLGEKERIGVVREEVNNDGEIIEKDRAGVKTGGERERETVSDSEDESYIW